jgi:ADP-ribose pyrophosphatase YjhB (NUDIX family)
MIKHLTSSVFILSGRSNCRIVLLRHKQFSKWMIPGGHVESWENPFEAALREVREETGLDPQFVTFAGDRAPPIANYVPHPEIIVEETIPATAKDPEHIHVDFLYIALANSLRLCPGSKEAKQVALFRSDDLVDLDMFEQTRDLARAIMADLRNGRDLWSVVGSTKRM